MISVTASMVTVRALLERVILKLVEGQLITQWHNFYVLLIELQELWTGQRSVQKCNALLILLLVINH